MEIRGELAPGHQSNISDSANKHNEAEHLPLIDGFPATNTFSLLPSILQNDKVQKFWGKIIY